MEGAGHNRAGQPIKWQGEGCTMKKWSGKKVLAMVLAVAVLASAGIGGRRRRVVESFAPVRLTQRQLILDAGHGGEDGGAVSITGVPESHINLAVTLKLDQLLGFYGLSPILLRETDVSLYDPGCETLRQKKVSDLHNRVATVESTPDALLVSIHQNTFSNPAYHGAQVFFRVGEESEALAELTQKTLRQGLDPANKRTPTKIPDSVYLMKHINCPAILIECGFLSNAEEEAKLREGGYQTKLALCITSALLKSGEEADGSGTPGTSNV